MTDMCNCCNAVHIRTMSAQKLSCHSLLSLMPSRQALQQEDAFFRIMKILHHNTNVSQRMLAKHVGLSLGGLNYCLKLLVSRGWVRVESESGRQRLAYMLTQGGHEAMQAIGQRFLQRKTAELRALQAEIDAMRQYSVEATA